MDENRSGNEGEDIQQVLEKIEDVGVQARKFQYVLSRLEQVSMIMALFMVSFVILFGFPIFFRIPPGDSIWLLTVAVIAAIQLIMTGTILKSLAAEIGVIEGESIPKSESFIRPPIWIQFPVVISRDEIQLTSPIGHRPLEEQLEFFNLFPGESLPSQAAYATGLWIILTLINWTVISAPYTIGFLDPIFIGSVEMVELYAENGVSEAYISFYLVTLPLLIGEISGLGIRAVFDIRGWTSRLQERIDAGETSTFWTQSNIRSFIELATFTIISWIVVNGLVLGVDNFSPSAPAYASFLAGWGIVTTKHMIDTYVTTTENRNEQKSSSPT